MSTLKNWVKSDPSVYSAIKILRDIRKFPLSQPRGLRKLGYVYKVYPRTMLPPVRLFSLCDAVDTVNRENIAGDIAECGVWSGGSLALAAMWDMQYPSSRRLYHAFDSFEGLPPPTPEDGEVFDTFNRNSVSLGRAASGAARHTGVCVGDGADVVRQFFAGLGIPRERSRFHVGWFQDTVPAAAPTIAPLSILRIDGDWYDSTKVCLDHLYDAVSPGGFVIIDDYGCFDGCKRAVDEFRAVRGITAPITAVDDHCVYFRKPA